MVKKKKLNGSKVANIFFSRKVRQFFFVPLYYDGSSSLDMKQNSCINTVLTLLHNIFLSIKIVLVSRIIPVSLLHCMMCCDTLFPRVKFGTKGRKRGKGVKLSLVN